ncbi:MAG TPA: enoyl-CoA hydratase-related protein [Acidimicrobiia bacterium]|nr:enoyl-CoA hydratase-related protein [Acidimicrobiia bacterium]
MVPYDITDGVATLTIDDVARRNPLSSEAIEGLIDGMERALADTSVSVIVITGAGDAAFSAGGDLSSGFFDDPVANHAARGRFADLLRLLWRGGKPTVARVNGHAMAGGFGLAVACDVTVCVDDARLGVPEVKVGLWPMMITVALLRAMPQKAALELMLTGRTVTPDEAMRLGAVSRVVRRQDLDDAVAEIVEALKNAPSSVLLGRDAFFTAAATDPDTALDRLQAGLTAVAGTLDAREGIAAFIEKRPARFEGR